MAVYKVPKQIVLRKELLMTPVGKVIRKELRGETLKERKSKALGWVLRA